MKNNRGALLPMVVLLLVILSIATFSVVQHFTQTNKMESYHFIAKNELLGGAMAGINLALQDIKNPADDTLSHVWQENYHESYTLDLGDQNVTVTEDHVEMNLQ